MALDADDFAFVRHFLQAQSGMVLGTGKEYLVEARLTPVAQQAGFASLQELITHLRQRAPTALCLQVVEALVTHETQFFRDGRPSAINSLPIGTEVQMRCSHPVIGSAPLLYRVSWRTISSRNKSKSH